MSIDFLFNHLFVVAKKKKCQIVRNRWYGIFFFFFVMYLNNIAMYILFNNKIFFLFKNNVFFASVRVIKNMLVLNLSLLPVQLLLFRRNNSPSLQRFYHQLQE